MSRIVLDCNKCGGALEVTEDMEMFRCQYCGTPYLVERKDGATRIIQLEQRVSQLEERQVETESTVSEIGVKQESLDSGVAKIELKELREKQYAVAESWAKERFGPIGATIGAFVITFAILFFLSSFDVVEFNQVTFPLVLFGFPLIIGATSLSIWLKEYRSYRRRRDELQKKEQEIRQRIQEPG